MPAPEAVLRLVERFESNREAYQAADYNETQTRLDFLDPFFKALGWHVYNEQGYAEQWREVVHEDAFRMGGVMNAPDYSFRLGGRRLFFLEAKKPSIDLSNDPAPAFQLRRYAWTAKLPLSILTNFAEFIVYDTRVRPASTDSPSKARVMHIRCDQYAERWDEIASIFSPQAIRRGAFEKYVQSATGKHGTAEVDEAFLAEIAEWRELLAHNVALRNHDLTQRQINYAVQATVDRIVFLRICEDRRIESYGRIQALLNGQNVYARLRDLYRQADERYNSGLFHFRHERDRAGTPDELTPGLTIDDGVLKDIFRRLYYPDCPYEFSVLPAEILGQVYERFLGSVITLTKGGRAKVEEKPEVRKAGGVYYTPAYIVDYIVRQTVGELLAGKTPQDIAGVTEAWRPSRTHRPLSILDPACGSGSFLIGAYQFLLDWHLDYYTKDTGTWSTGGHPTIYQNHRGTWHLTTAERKRILLANIFGVDIDPQAVEVTKLSLLLKVLEGENAETLQRQLALFHERALPDLAGNIKCGNSLIGPDFYNGHQMNMFDEEEMHRVNVFNWNDEFTEIMQGGGFDAVIGNPPYVRIQTLTLAAPAQAEYFRRKYACAQSGNYDIYVLFAERGLSLLRQGARLGFILPSKFFTTDYGLHLRRLITDKRALIEIVDFAHGQVFRNATTYTCLLFLSGSASESFLYRRLDKPMEIGADTSEPVQFKSDTVSEAPWVFHSEASEAIVTKLTRFGVPLLDLCSISRGSSTGDDNVFVLRESGHGFVTSEGQAVAVEPEITRIPIYATDFGRYSFAPNSGHRVIFPYIVSSTEYHLIPEAQLRSEYPQAYDYLNSRKKRLTQRRQYRSWYGFSAPRGLGRHEDAHLLIPLLAERGSVCRIPADSRQYCLMASGGFSISVKPEAQLAPDYILGLLNSKLLFWRLRSISSKFRGGWITCTKQYVGTLPIHVPSSAGSSGRRDRIVSLVRRMLDIRARLNSASTAHERTLLERQIAAADRQIDQLVYELYELTDAEIVIVEEVAKEP